MRVSLVAGFFYFLVVGAAGVFFGALREMFVTPVVGHSIAVALELPIMLAVARYICPLLVKWCGVPDKILPRLAMGFTAFGLLMVMEQSLTFALQKMIMEQAPRPWSLIDYVGIAGQVIFGLMPLLLMFNVRAKKTPDASELFHKVRFPKRPTHS